MMETAPYGLLGEHLGHSYSPRIHSMLASYGYELFEKAPEEVEDFVKNGDWKGLNVTIPYKKTVIPYCTELSEKAARIGAVNTLVRTEDGGIFGDNTDAYGFGKLIGANGIEIKDKKCLVFGSGGASAMAVEVLKSLGAQDVTVISRRGENNYDNLYLHSDAELIVNTTPVGMFPKNGEQAADLRLFPKLKAVLDVVYNPDRTALLLQAEALGIKHCNGLYMLVAQAKRSSELFTGEEIPDEKIGEITEALRKEALNTVLIGMPGCGKSSIAKLLSKKLSRSVIEADALIEEKAGMSIPEIFADRGEEGFRKLETEVLAEQGKLSGKIISTGGGCVTRQENYPLLHQNGTIVWIKRNLSLLPKDGRPLSLKNDLSEMYEKRKPCYERFADIVINNDGEPEAAAQRILEALK